MGIGKRIRQARENAGLTREELADKIGVTASAISNYENNISHPKEKILYSLIETLGVDANFLFQDAMSKIKEKPITEDELSGVKADLMQYIRALDDEQVKAIKSLIQTALQIGGQ